MFYFLKRNLVAACIVTIILFFSHMSSPGIIHEKANCLAPLDIFDMQYAMDPQISPDGSKIIYTRQFFDIKSDNKYSNLWVLNFDGSMHRCITSGNNNDSSPQWSPDGGRIVYISDRDGLPQIYLRWMDSGLTAKLTNLIYPPSGISWSPDGKYISFISFVPEEPGVIAKLPEPPPGAKWADRAVVIDKLVYRNDGGGYLKPGYAHLFIMPAEGGYPHQLSSGNFSDTSAGAASWSPDGKYILLSANRHPEFEYDPLNTEIYEFSVADGTVRALTSRKGPDNSPAISPDGKCIAYVGFDDQYQGYQVTRLYIMNRDGSNSRILSGDLDRDVSRPCWSPDGSGIYFIFNDQGNTKLGFYNLSGRFKQVTKNIGSGGSAYSFGGAYYSVARNGRFACTYTRPDIPGDISAGTFDNLTSKVITALNDGLLAHKNLGEVEEIWFNSSLDQRRMQGWIIKPPGFDQSKKYPLILEIHGGPFANYGDRFDFEKQMMAAHGYVVFYANPRGSTSYGEKFGNLIHHAYPGDDYYDLNSGVDAVISKGYVDPGNIFITGGSGGGVLTCWTIGKTDRFRAAVSAYPVINWYSFSLTTDTPAGILYLFPGFPWDYTDNYMKRSVISQVKSVKTPTMLITGEKDFRTPISESEQYYQALKLLRIESVLIRVPGESHGITGQPSHQLAKVLYTISWFDKHRENSQK